MVDRIDELLERRGTTYAAEAGIRLADKPGPLYQLLVLTTLLSVRIRANVAVAAAEELFRAGWRTPKAMRESTWQDRVDALGRAHYRRYDESTATALARGAELVRARYHDDLRRMRSDAHGDRRKLHQALTEFPRIGPVGADIFCREVQMVWPELRPFFDDRATRTAEKLHLPTQPDELAELVAGDDLARLAAALVRASLDPK